VYELAIAPLATTVADQPVAAGLRKACGCSGPWPLFVESLFCVCQDFFSIRHSTRTRWSPARTRSLHTDKKTTTTTTTIASVPTAIPRWPFSTCQPRRNSRSTTIAAEGPAGRTTAAPIPQPPYPQSRGFHQDSRGQRWTKMRTAIGRAAAALGNDWAPIAKSLQTASFHWAVKTSELQQEGQAANCHWVVKTSELQQEGAALDVHGCDGGVDVEAGGRCPLDASASWAVGQLLFGAASSPIVVEAGGHCPLDASVSWAVGQLLVGAASGCIVVSCRSCGRGCSRGCGYGGGPASCLWLRGMSKSARRHLDAKGGCAADMPAERACNVQARLRAASHAMNSRVSRAEHGSRAAKQPITSRASSVFRGPIHPAIAP
jgi:hypothetical protein